MIRYVVGIDLTSVTGVVIHAGKLVFNAPVYKLTVGGGGAVDSVNGQTGVVVLDANDVGAYPDNNPSNYVDSAGAATAAPVQSVNGQTGAVVLTASDVGAPSGSGSSTGTNTGDQDLSGLQPLLISGTNIKTVGGTSLLGAGYIPLGGASPEIMYCRLAPVTVTGLTAETLVHSLPIPTNIGNGWFKITYFQQIQTFVAAASCRIRIGTIANPNTAQMVASQVLAQNAAGSSTGIDIFRDWPIIGGASGNIKASNVSANVRSDEASAAALVTYNIDWTAQHYLYFTVTPANTGNVLESNGILVEFIEEKL